MGADHGGGVQNRLRFGGQPIDAGGEHRLHRCGDGDLIDIAHQAVSATTPRQHTAAGQVPDDLLGEKRVARSRDCDPSGQAIQR